LKCEFCGKEESLPFVCNYCGGAFCADHRLPEAHQCKGDLTQKRTIVAPPQTTFSWSGDYSPRPMPRQTSVFSAIEVRDIVVAWVGLGVAFALALLVQEGLIYGGASPRLGYGFALYVFFLSLVTVGSGFVLHELSHKFVAQRYGYWAEFRMWPLGLVLALVTSLGGLIFAAPGATYISGANISQPENGRISLAGPLTNVAVAALFLPFLFSSGVYGDLGGLGVRINLFLAAFNLIPFGPLDGAKVFRWNTGLWASVFVPLLVALYFVYTAL
jgi:Zn-dependent protease